MQKLKLLLVEWELLITIGTFGLAQMIADLSVDMGRSEFAAVIRFVGIIIVIGVLILGFWQRPSPLRVPLLFVEEDNSELAHTKFERLVESLRLEKSVKVIDAHAPVHRQELVIRLDTAVRYSSKKTDWQEALKQLIHEWDKEVDARLQRWLPAHYSGIIYHIRPNIVLPLAFGLGAAVGLRRSVILYHQAAEGAPYQVMDLTHPRVLFEEPKQPIDFEQQPPDIRPPADKGDHLILHWIFSDRHQPDLNAHPDYSTATSVAFYHSSALPQDDWLSYVQTLYRWAKPWVNAFKQVDICLICPDALAFALGMAFSRSAHLRVCHWMGAQYMPVVNLSWIERRLPFD
ncbi:hypothetical protein HRbin15_01192 [bacterium HR15]|nr:hypothetical protein HRbin15_01192 [bacterium HR15]